MFGHFPECKRQLEIVRTTSKDYIEDEIPTVFAVVSCPANMIDLQTVSVEISG